MTELRLQLALQGRPSHQQQSQALQEAPSPDHGWPQLLLLLQLVLPLAQLLQHVLAVQHLPVRVPAV